MILVAVYDLACGERDPAISKMFREHMLHFLELAVKTYDLITDLKFAVVLPPLAGKHRRIIGEELA